MSSTVEKDDKTPKGSQIAAMTTLSEKIPRVKNTWLRAVVAFIFCILIATVAELGVFNFGWLSSFTAGAAVTVVPYDGSYGQTINGTSLTLNNVDASVSSVRIQFADDEWHEVSVNVMDESKSSYKWVGNIYESGEPLYLHTEGKTLSIRLDTKTQPTSEIASITLNGATPLDFSPMRWALIGLLLFAFWLIRPSSPWWTMRVLDHKKAFPLCASVMCLVALATLAVAYSTQTLDANDIRGMGQYTDLARALASGNVYLDIEPSSGLLALSNPYDDAARDGVEYLWDYAFFGGKYYTYFGVVPCLVFYLPYYLITGGTLPNLFVTAIATLAFYLGGLYLVRRIIGRWFPQATIISLVLCAVVMVFGTMSLSLVSMSTIYPVPIACGVACAVWGLALWLKACEGERFLWGRALVGTLLAALTLGCRPQLFLVFLFILVLFIDAVRRGLIKARAFFLLIIPILIVGILLCIYNYARFGSPFDFGSSYNLTNDDMSKHSVTPYVSVLGIFGFLLQPPQIISDWPFVDGVSLSHIQNSDLVIEETIGGIFAVVPLMLSAFWFFWNKRLRQTSILTILSIIGVVCTLILTILDISAGGLILRYQVDLAFFAMLPAIIGIMATSATLLPAPQEAVNAIDDESDATELQKSSAEISATTNLQYAVKLAIFALACISIAISALYFLGIN